MASVNIHCPRCQSAQVYRHGQNPKGHDRFRCRDCHRVFQLTYTYEARLTLRTRIKRLARKTICFSRSVEIHEKVIGTFIEKHMFY
ncbi:Transposase [Shigella dysenteriae 1617]|uniref:Transposase n=1 Tax=Shigella dysenteriae 1617 TaxID=754093 RepID=A0A0A7A4D0_SHIDY|nr:Transposase [Shigella dysenteriae 1617]